MAPPEIDLPKRLAATTTFSHPLSLLIWLVLQLLVLLLPVLQIPLSDQFPRPAEKLAMDEMIVAQICFSALLFPLLMPSIGAIFVIIATTWPFLILATVLSSTPPHRVVQVAIFLSLWLCSLGILSAGSTTLRWRMWWTAIASTISIGGGITAYLRAEFAAAAIDGLHFGPIVGALDVLHLTENRAKPWLFLALFFALATSARIIFVKLARKNSRQLIHNFGG